jgi:uncharacterized protein (DUF927 family)
MGKSVIKSPFSAPFSKGKSVGSGNTLGGPFDAASAHNSGPMPQEVMCHDLNAKQATTITPQMASAPSTGTMGKDATAANRRESFKK